MAGTVAVGVGLARPALTCIVVIAAIMVKSEASTPIALLTAAPHCFYFDPRQVEIRPRVE